MGAAVGLHAVHQHGVSLGPQLRDGPPRFGQHEVQVRVLVRMGAVDQSNLDVRHRLGHMVIGDAAQRHHGTRLLERGVALDQAFGVHLPREVSQHADTAEQILRVVRVGVRVSMRPPA